MPKQEFLKSIFINKSKQCFTKITCPKKIFGSFCKTYIYFEHAFLIPIVFILHGLTLFILQW